MRAETEERLSKMLCRTRNDWELLNCDRKEGLFTFVHSKNAALSFTVMFGEYVTTVNGRDVTYKELNDALDDVYKSCMRKVEMRFVS